MAYDATITQPAPGATDVGVRVWAESLDEWVEHTEEGRAWLAEQAAMEDERHGRSLWQGPSW